METPTLTRVVVRNPLRTRDSASELVASDGSCHHFCEFDPRQYSPLTAFEDVKSN